MFDDFKELLSIFNDQKVKYLIVGGYAVSLHAQPRATKDIDLLIQPAPAFGCWPPGLREPERKTSPFLFPGRVRDRHVLR
jgi:hypothetical protein